MTIDELLELEEIRSLGHAYAQFRDNHDLEGLASLFTSDAVCEFGELGGNVVGRDAIRAHFARSLETYNPSGPMSSIHLSANPWIVFTGADRAEGRWFLVDFLMSEGVEQPLKFLGAYDDVYAKGSGGWLIHRRRLELSWPQRETTGGIPGRRVAGAIDALRKNMTPPRMDTV